jgi:hypothetical protein
MRESATNIQHTPYFGYGFFSYAGDWFVSGAEARCVVV